MLMYISADFFNFLVNYSVSARVGRYQSIIKGIVVKK